MQPNTFHPFLVLLFFPLVLSSDYITLTYSSKASKVVSPANAPPIQFGAYAYPSKITQVPEADWIWAGYGNDKFCPMEIVIEDQVSVTCLMQPIVLYAAADNFFNATFFGESFVGDHWSRPVSKSIDPKGKVCNGTYKFSITAWNEVMANKIGCEGNNWAAVIYGVIQYKADTCCENTGFYYSAITCECYPCTKLFEMGCTNCTLTSCTKCNATQNFILNGTKCVCKSDQYTVDSSIDQCILCNSTLDKCVTCSDKDTCTKCQVGYKLNPSTNKCEKCEVGCLSCDYTQCFICDTSKDFGLLNLNCVCNETSGLFLDECKLCSVMIHNCTTCVNGTFCTTCENRTMLNTDSSICEGCPADCAACEHSIGCLTCDLGYEKWQNGCRSQCGNGILISVKGEQCDDGNLLNGDGCSQDCRVEKNFTCFGNDGQLSNCSYSGWFRMFIIWVKKQYYSNKIQMSIGIRPLFPQLSLVNFTESITMNNSLRDCGYTFNSQNGSLHLFYNFTETLQGQFAQLIFSPAASSHLFSSTPISTLQIELITNSNIPITYYDPFTEYQLAELIKKIVIFGISVSYFLALASLIINKAVGSQLSYVWQVAFFSLGILDKVHPVLSGIFTMEVVSGYNWMPIEDDRSVPDRINSIKYSGSMTKNINFNLILLFAVTFILPGLVYLSSFAIKKHKEKIRNIANKIMKQYSFVLVLFSSMNIGYSSGLQIMYGEWTTLNSIITFTAIAVVFLTYLGMNWTDSAIYGHFSTFLKSTPESKFYFSINLLYRFCQGFILSILNYSPHIGLYSLLLSIIFLVYVISTKPFITGYLNYQSTLCQITTVYILGTRMFYRSMKHNYPIRDISKVLLPSYIEILLILVCMFTTLMVLIYEIFVKYQYCRRKQGQKDGDGGVEEIVTGRMDKVEKTKRLEQASKVEFTLENIYEEDEPAIDYVDHSE